MIATAIFLVLAFLAVIFFLAAARGRSSSVRQLSDLQGQTRPVDIAAYRNLVDPAEEQFLKEKLPPADFRRIQRERLLAARDYIHCAAANAAVLLRVGEAARASEDPGIAQAGQDLVNQALRLRLYALIAETKLLVAFLLPGHHISASGVSDAYEKLTGAVGRLGRLQELPYAARVVSSL